MTEILTDKLVINYSYIFLMGNLMDYLNYLKRNNSSWMLSLHSWLWERERGDSRREKRGQKRGEPAYYLGYFIAFNMESDFTGC